MSRIKWHLETWSIDRLKPYEKNPRIITEYGLNQLAMSFDAIGMAQPINVNLDGTILSGHARYYRLKEENAKEVDVYLPSRFLNEDEEKSVIVLMNKAVAGRWDMEILANEYSLEDLKEYGFTDKELELATDPYEKQIDIEGLPCQCPKCGHNFYL